MTLLSDKIYEEYVVADGDTEFVISGTPAFIRQDVDESLKVYIREDAREFIPSNVNFNTEEITISQHSYSSGLDSKVTFSTDGVAPDGLVNGEEYYVQVIDENTIKLSSTTPNGTAVNLNSQGSGTHKFESVDPNGIVLLKDVDFTVTKDGNGAPVKITFINRSGIDGQKLFITRESNLLQEDVDYDYASSWKPVEYETHIDKIYAILQEQGNKLSRAMLTRIGDTTTSNLTFPVPQDNHTIGWYPIGTDKFAFRNYDMSLYVTDEELAAAQAAIQANIDANTSLINNNSTLISNNTTNITTNATSITANTNAITALQLANADEIIVNSTATIVIDNNATVPGPLVTESVVIHFEVSRDDTVEQRLALGTIKVLRTSATTFSVSDPEYFIPTGNPPGLTFTMNGGVVEIAADDMAGGPHAGSFKYSMIRLIGDDVVVLAEGVVSDVGTVIDNSVVVHFELIRTGVTAVGKVNILLVGGTYYVSDPEYFTTDATMPGLSFGMNGNVLQVTTAADGNGSGTFTYRIININP